MFVFGSKGLRTVLSQFQFTANAFHEKKKKEKNFER